MVLEYGSSIAWSIDLFFSFFFLEFIEVRIFLLCVMKNCKRETENYSRKIVNALPDRYSRSS